MIVDPHLAPVSLNMALNDPENTRNPEKSAGLQGFSPLNDDEDGCLRETTSCRTLSALIGFQPSYTEHKYGFLLPLSSVNVSVPTVRPVSVLHYMLFQVT